MPPANGNTRKFYKGQVIIKEGQPVSYAYVVMQGTVSVYRVVNNRRVVLAKLSAGQVIGELGALTGEPANASVIADEYSELMLIDRKRLQGLLKKSPSPIQHILKFLIERLRRTDSLVREQPSGDIFTASCRILELLQRGSIGRGGGEDGVSQREFYKTARDILVVSRLELDAVVDKLVNLGLVEAREIKSAKYEKDIFGQRNKSGEVVQDRVLRIKDLKSFSSVARNVSQEIMEDGGSLLAGGFDFVDMEEFAQMAGVEPEQLAKKVCNREVPFKYFFVPRGEMEAWIEEVGKDFFKKVKRRRLNVDELETVDDVTAVDGNTLSEALTRMGHREMAVLYAGAEAEARDKMLSVLSKKMAGVLQESAAEMVVDDAELADAEHDLIEIIKEIKAPKK
jgi:CRP-like cAMP-binding protein